MDAALPQNDDLTARRLPDDWLRAGMHEPFAGKSRLQ
jgi:hypothetical protein